MSCLLFWRFVEIRICPLIGEWFRILRNILKYLIQSVGTKHYGLDLTQVINKNLPPIPELRRANHDKQIKSLGEQRNLV